VFTVFHHRCFAAPATGGDATRGAGCAHGGNVPRRCGRAEWSPHPQRPPPLRLPFLLLFPVEARSLSFAAAAAFPCQLRLKLSHGGGGRKVSVAFTRIPSGRWTPHRRRRRGAASEFFWRRCEMDVVCEVCGVVGYKHLLVQCNSCRNATRHR